MTTPPASVSPASVSPTAPPRLALIGSPNSGKTTLFNALTGLRQKVANYAGVTVDHVQANVSLPHGKQVTLIDLPGTYALTPLSPDEAVTLDVLRGAVPECPKPDGVLVVADATTLRRSLQLLGEVLLQNLPTALILTMVDEMKARGGAVDVPRLQRRLGIPVLGIVGNKGIGLDDVRHLIGQPDTWMRAKDGAIPSEIEARFGWVDALVEACTTKPSAGTALTDRIDGVLLHPGWGLGVFAVLMFVFFQLIFAVAAPLQDLFEGAVGELGGLVGHVLPEGVWWSGLIVDGVIGGVGAVVVFVPQIALLLLAIGILEHTGYMARAAFLIDRVMGWAGLEGRSFIALLSSYACAIPGIMATRAIPDPRSRLSTILVAPFMTCSARLPVYALLIGAFIPAETVGGIFGVQGLVLFGLYLLGSVSALVAAALFKRGLLRGRTYPFYMELPPYRWPTMKVVGLQVWRGVRAFLKKAGTVILGAAVVLWVLLNLPPVEVPAHIAGDEAASKAYQIQHSWAADVGRAIEPAIEPIGFDWKIGVGLLASLSAREVIVSSMAQTYAFGGDEEDLEGLGERLKADVKADGTPVYTLATVLSLLVFYVYALQCISTIGAIRRETGGWRWPAFAVTYMFVVAYAGSFVTYQLTRAFS